MNAFEHATPEDLQAVSESAVDAAEALRGSGKLVESTVVSNHAITALGFAQILDRLERIILLLDERLPARPAADPLEGTVESRG